MLLSLECFSHATVTQLVCLGLVDAVVIFTTVICGGLTEPLLKYTKLKVHLYNPSGLGLRPR